LAIDKEKIVGFIEVGLTKIYQNITAGAIWDLAIDKKYRKRGISTKLRDAGNKWLKERDAKYIIVRHDPNNKIAEKIYKKWGFEIDMVERIAKLK
jgi:ribosomal protein S18 acetylase RimI-like enzyme